MQLPKYNETYLPILQTLSSVESINSNELALRIQKEFYSDLPLELLQKKTKKGRILLIDRILWGKSYLKMGCFVSYPKRGWVQLTEKGKIASKKKSFTHDDLKNDFDFIEYQNSSKKNDDTSLEFNLDEIENATPQDLIDSGFQSLEKEVKTELLEKLKELNPYHFENVILKLLQKMGYGDFVETPKSNDGGIDGIINQDKLGLEKIYTQAKRFVDTKVRETDIRNFIGAMSGDTSKGIFITTSSFDDAAKKKAKEAHHTIVLIDGAQLVDLMFEFNIGVQIKTIYETKEIDNDFFEEY